MSTRLSGQKLKFCVREVPQEVEVAEWWLKDILPKNRLVLLSASGGTGKTSLCCYFAETLWNTMGVKTIFWSFEDEPADFRNKVSSREGIRLLETKLVSKNYDEEGEYETESTGFFDWENEDDWDGLRWKIREEDAGLLVIDPVTQLYGGDGNDGQEVRRFMTRLCEFAKEEQVTIIAICHNRKDTKADGNNARGSTSWTDVPRSYLELQADNEDRLFLEVKKTNITKRGLSWEVFPKVEFIQDARGQEGTVFKVIGISQVTDYAVTEINKHRDNTPLVVKKMKAQFDIGRIFNLDDVRKCGSYSEFRRWQIQYPDRYQESDTKKDGKKAWFFI